MTKQTKELRKSIVISIEIERNTPNSNFDFSARAKLNGVTTHDFWIVFETTRHGALPPELDLHFFETEEDARQYVSDHPVGTEKKRPENLGELIKNTGDTKLISLVEEIFNDPCPALNLLGARDDDGSLAWTTTKEAGLNDGLRLSPMVSDFLGEVRIDQLKTIHGDNWRTAAEMEYCFQNFPSSSLAYVAAQRQYNYYITQDDFSAGYLQRDLEILSYGIEHAAQKANEYAERQAKRALKGGEANARKAEIRQKTFFKLALSNISSWIWKSESEQRRYLKSICASNDAQTGEGLFTHGSNPLSDRWFDEMLSNLRQSGQLEKILTK